MIYDLDLQNKLLWWYWTGDWGKDKFDEIVKFSYTEKTKKERTLGGNFKLKLFSTPFVNITDPKTKKTEKVKILRYEENPASKELSRRHILTKGAIIQTEKGLAKITSRPGQHGMINAVLLGEE